MGKKNAATAATRSGAVVTIAVIAMNLGTYGFNVAAAHLMGPQGFGAVAAALNVLLVLTVLQLGLQTVGARRITSDPDHADEVAHNVLLVGRRLALGAAFVGVLAAPLVNYLLRLESLPTAILIGVVAYPFTLTGAYAGVLQGNRRWTPLALTYAGLGLPRLALGVGMILIRPTQFSAMVGITIAALVPLAVAVVAVRRTTSPAGRGGPHTPRALSAETVRNSQALLAFLALSSVDLLVARNLLSAHDAGLYAAGALLAKAVLFLPQFVVVLAFPSMGRAELHRDVLLKSLGVAIGLGMLVVAGVALLPDLALAFVGGTDYAEMRTHLWGFALLGTALSVVQILIYAVMSQQTRGRILWVWAGLVALVIAGRGADSPVELFRIVLTIDAVVALVLLTVALAPRRRASGQRSPQ